MSRTLIVGDVHGCAEELTALIALASPDRLVLLGDLFTKGPDPKGVWAIIQRHKAVSVLGNHDAAVLKLWRAGEPIPVPEAAARWLALCPLFLDEEGKDGKGWRAVHAGIHPRLGPEGTSRRDALNLRRWPEGGEGSPNPFWWELYRGPPLVVYGHDARRGLVDRRPHTLGLDTGCVYGGALSGFIPEEGRILRVPATRTHRSVQG